MLSRADRILAELAVSRGQATREAVDSFVQDGKAGLSLADFLVLGGHLKGQAAASLAAEAAAVERALERDPPSGQRVGDFKLIREIGRGGMAVVFEAEQESLGRRVALKILPAGAAFDSQLRARFLREARAAAQLSHPGIVKVHDFGQAGDIWFLAMELAEKGTLEDVVKDRGIEPLQAARWVLPVAQGLVCAHRAGLVHRDIKPSNILIGADGLPRLSDFGLVYARGEASLTLAAAVLGTPAYIAPEQARGEKADPRSDIYGLGAVLYALLSGGPPYPGEIPSLVLARVLAEPPRPLGERRPGLPAGLVAVCEKAMSREPQARYSGAQDLADDLERFVAGQEPLAGQEVRKTPFPGAGRHRRRRILAAGAVLGLAAAAVWLVLAGPPWRSREPPAEAVEAAPAGEFTKSRAISLGVAGWGSGRPRIAALPGSFVAGWTAEGGRVVVRRIDFQGRPLDHEPRQISALGHSADQVDLAWNGRQLGAVWRETGNEKVGELRFALLDLEARPAAAKSLEVSGRNPRLLWAGDFFACAWERESARGSAVDLIRLDAEGRVASGPEVLMDGADQPALAWNGERAAAAFHDLDQDTVSVRLFGRGPGSLHPAARVSQDRPSGWPALAAREKGFAILYRNIRWGKDWVFFRLLGSEGRPAGKELLAGQEGSIDPALAAMDGGFGFVAEAQKNTPPADVAFFRLSARGERSNSLNVSSSPLVGSVEPALSWNGSHFGVVWKESRGEGGAQTIQFARVYRRTAEGGEGLSLGPSALGGKEP